MTRNRTLCLAAALAVAFCLAQPTGATTIAPPRDLGELAWLADTVVVATAGDSTVRRGGLGIETVTAFHLREVVAGRAPQKVFLVAEPGGILDGLGLAVAGVPRFERGATYLLFLAGREDGPWSTPMAAWGVLVEREPGRLEWVPEALEVGMVGQTAADPFAVYDRGALVAQLRKAAAGEAYDLAAAEIPGAAPAAPPPNCVRMEYGGVPIRWFGFETGTRIGVWATTPGQTGLGDGGQSAVSNATAAWRNYSAAVLNMDYNGVKARTLDCGQGNRRGEVWFDDPCNAITDLSGCTGTLAQGGLWFSGGTQSYDGELWHPGIDSGTYGPYVVVNNGAECIGPTNFQEVMAHELGHSLGFGHHTDSGALMYWLCCRGGGAQLYATDKICASAQYHTFLDVPYSYWAWSFIEGIEDAGITAGCGNGDYCPESNVTRAQMAVFLLVAKHGSGYTPPGCSGMFSDVPCPGYWAADWIEQLANEGITAGCGGGKYCPEDPVTRAQMAVFLLAAKHGSGYTPPGCSGMFSDVPCPGYWAADWIEQLANEGITAGCGGGKYCPEDPVTRAQMAVFLVATFSIPHP